MEVMHGSCLQDSVMFFSTLSEGGLAAVKLSEQTKFVLNKLLKMKEKLKNDISLKKAVTYPPGS